MFPEARDKPIWRVMYDAHTHGGDPVEILKYRAEKAEALLKQIACNTDPVWARKLACDFWGIPASPYGKASMQEDKQATRGDDAATAPTTTDTKDTTK